MAFETDSFFWKLNYLQETLSGVRQFKDENGNLIVYDKNTQNCLYRIIDYISAGAFTDSKVEKFICKYWRKKPAELVKLWKKETGKDKTASCFRSQRSKISRELLAIFGEDMVVDILDNNPDNLLKILDTLMMPDIPFADMFIKEIQVDNQDDLQVNNYTIKELEYELSVLRKYNLEEIKSVISKTDKSKLFYIRRVLNQDLVTSGLGINNRKMALLQEIYKSESDL